MYPFGADGTLAWTTHAGELLFTANCIRNRLLGVEYARSIERGQRYNDRGKMLQKAVTSPQGDGFGIGISLDNKLEPLHVSWIHNRWPRYTYKTESLDIRLQYYIESQSVIQQYQIRNNSPKDVPLSYYVSSNICFREHKGGGEESYPIPTSKSSARLLLFENSEIVVRNDIEPAAQMKMSIFFNSQRIPSWKEGMLSVNSVNADEAFMNHESVETPDLRRAQEQLRNAILSRRFLSQRDNSEFEWLYGKDYDQNLRGKRPRTFDPYNFSICKNEITIPKQSTQELCAIVQIRDVSVTDLPPRGSPPSDKAIDSQKQIPDAGRMPLSNRWDKLSNLMSTFEIEESFGSPDSVLTPLVLSILSEHASIGRLLVQQKWVGEARYHFHAACLITESFFKDDTLRVRHTRYRYAKFLDHHGWCSAALAILNELYRDLGPSELSNKDLASLWMEILGSMGSMYIDKGHFSMAEDLYKEALARNEMDNESQPSWMTYCISMIAWTQAHQYKYKEADASYAQLSTGISPSRGSFLSNRGFIKRRLGKFKEARSLYTQALAEFRNGADRTPGDERRVASPPPMADERSAESRNNLPLNADVLYVLSGLHSSMVPLPEAVEKIAGIETFVTDYVDINLRLNELPRPRMATSSDDPLHFAVGRQLECLLSVCSIAITGEKDDIGIAFLDADPLNSACLGRNA